MMISKETAAKFAAIEKLLDATQPRFKADVDSPDYIGHPYDKDPKTTKDNVIPIRRCFKFPEAIFEQILIQCLVGERDGVNKALLVLQPEERIELFGWLFMRARNKAGYTDTDVLFVLMYCVNYLQQYFLFKLDAEK